MRDKKILFSSADGPESLEIYTSEDGAIVDWAGDIPALYVNATINGACVNLGPFHLSKIRKDFEKLLDPTIDHRDLPSVLDNCDDSMDDCGPRWGDND